MDQQRRELAMAIKLCLDSLARDATAYNMSELAHFVSLAALAAEEVAGKQPAQQQEAEWFSRHAANGIGHC